MIGILAIALTGWATVVALVSEVAVFRALRARKASSRPGENPIALETVCLIRPCCTDEPGLVDRLVSGRRLGVRQVFTVARAHDAAWPVVQAAAAALQAAGVSAQARVVPTEAPNQKAGQWLGMLSAPDFVDCEVFVNVDSDVDLTGFSVRDLIAPLAHASVGASWCPPVEVGPVRGLGDRMSQAFLNGSLHAFALLGGLDPHGLVGKVCALHLPRVRAAGGLEGFDTLLGEDMELARRLRVAGLRAPMVPQAVRSEASGRSVGAAVARYGRWLAVIRAQRPALMWSYPGLFGATLPIAILSILLGNFANAGSFGNAITFGNASTFGMAALSIALTARLAVAFAARKLAGLSLNPGAAVIDVALGELITWAAWLSAMSSREVAWRGNRLLIPRGGGVLRALSAPAARPGAAASRLDPPEAAMTPPPPPDGRGGD